MNCATSRVVAVKEALGKALVGYRGVTQVPEALVSGLVVSAIRMPNAKLADFTNAKAAAFGIVAGDAGAPVGDDYSQTRKWAITLDVHFDGIRSRSRFDAGRGRCIFLFGSEGPAPQHNVLGAKAVIDFLKEEMSWVQVDPTPSSRDITIVE